MPLPLTDFHDLWMIAGAGSPIPDQAAGNRALTLLGTGTPPRPASFRRRRSAEFRSAAFECARPRSFGTVASGGTLHNALYVSSKIQSFTIMGWVKPQKSGISAFGFTPLGGLFSATNMGGTATPQNAPVFLLTSGEAGASRLVVALFGTYLDTALATQTQGPATTTPLADNDLNFVALRVTGSASVDNQVDLLDLVVISADGTRRVYRQVAAKAVAGLFYGVQPSDGQTVTIGGRAYTFKTALAGTPATGWVRNATAANPTDGETVVVGDDTYTFRSYVGPGLAGTQILEFNTTVSSDNAKQVDILVAGFRIVIQWNTKTASVPGGLTIYHYTTSEADLAAAVPHRAIHGDLDNDVGFSKPPAPTSGADVGKSWQNRSFTTGTATALQSDYSKGSGETPLRAIAAGTAGNAIRVGIEQPKGINSTWRIRVKGGATAPGGATAAGGSLNASQQYGYAYRYVDGSGNESLESQYFLITTGATNKTVNLTGITTGPVGTTKRRIYRTKGNGSLFFFLADINDNVATTFGDTAADTALGAQIVAGVLFSGGANPATAKSVLISGTWAATLANLVKAVNAAGIPGTDYSADITVANATATAVAVSNDMRIDSKYAGTAGNGKPLSDTSTVLDTSGANQFTGGVDGATADHVKIGATPLSTYENLKSALNLTGAKGIDYGDPTTINANVAGEHDILAGILLARAKTAGTAGNAITVATTATGASWKDQYGDKAATTLLEGQAAPPFAVPAGARPDPIDLRFLWGGWDREATKTRGIFYGQASDAAIANRALTDDELSTQATSPPPTSLRDKGWYRAASRVRIAFKSDRMPSWPVPRAVPSELFRNRIPVGIQGGRAATRIYSVEPGRPWSITGLHILTEFLAGRREGAQRVDLRWPDIVAGTDRASPAPKVSRLGAADSMNLSYSTRRARSRRGFSIVARSPVEYVNFPGAYYDVTDAAGEAFYLAMLAGTLYQVDGTALLQIDAGWAPGDLPTVATVGVKTFILTRERQKIFLQGSILDPGVAAPTSPPLYSGVIANTNGGVVALAPGYEYVVTFVQGAKGTESGPSAPTLVVLPPGSGPSTIKLTIPVGAAGTTQRKVYRRKFSTETYFRILTQNDNTTTLVNDVAEIPSGDALETWDGVPTGALWPAITACISHEGRLIGWGDPADKRLIYVSEVGDGERWFPYNILQADGEVRCCVSQEGRLVVFTDRTVEVVEGDWFRGSRGTLGVEQRVIDRSKGAFGPFSATSARGSIYWIDSNGVHTIGRGFDQRDSTVTISDDVHPLVQDVVDAQSAQVVVAFNHVSQELWACVTQSSEDGSVKNRAVLTYNLATRQWAPLDHALSWVVRVTDGLLGDRFLGVDYFGGILELDVLDGDGLQGNETYLPTSPVLAAVNATTKRLTFTGSTFPTDGSLRNVSVVLEDVSAGTLHRQTVLLAVSGTVLELDAVPANIAANDKAYVGGIASFVETNEEDGGDVCNKVWREAEVGLVDATQGRF